MNFNPRAPCGARLQEQAKEFVQFLFQSTRPLRGATPKGDRPCNRHAISIHAPLAGRDDNNGNNESTTGAISIHAPLAGRDKWSAAFSLST